MRSDGANAASRSDIGHVNVVSPTQPAAIAPIALLRYRSTPPWPAIAGADE